MFTNGMAESRAGRVAIDDYSAEAIRGLRAWLYGADASAGYLTVTDPTPDPDVTGDGPTIDVTPTTANGLELGSVGTVTAGVAFGLDVELVDVYSNRTDVNCATSSTLIRCAGDWSSDSNWRR